MIMYVQEVLSFFIESIQGLYIYLEFNLETRLLRHSVDVPYDTIRSAYLEYYSFVVSRGMELYEYLCLLYHSYKERGHIPIHPIRHHVTVCPRSRVHFLYILSISWTSLLGHTEGLSILPILFLNSEAMNHYLRK